jgi:hypothetical protein
MGRVLALPRQRQAIGSVRHLHPSLQGTVFSQCLELNLALSELGEETNVADLFVERVGEFFACRRVTKTRSGRPKSQLAVDKSRRVLRQALQ